MKWFKNQELEALKERLSVAKELLDDAIALYIAVEHNRAHHDQAEELHDNIRHYRWIRRNRDYD